jgi:hypothetical protein
MDEMKVTQRRNDAKTQAYLPQFFLCASAPLRFISLRSQAIDEMPFSDLKS